MHRRSFIKLAAGAGTLAPWLSSHRLFSTPVTDFNQQPFFLSLVRNMDRRIAAMLQRQEKNQGHRHYGAVRDAYSIHAASETAKFIRHLASVYCEPESRYFHSPGLQEPLLIAARCLRRMQHADGTIDLHTTNFNSPPDTGFVIEHLALAYEVLGREPDGDCALVCAALKEFMLSAGNGLCSGGIHTANHRWVVCMALARLNRFFPNPAYLQRIDQWLAEKIDIDPDGQYHEKSSAIYSPLTDRCLITLARLLQRPELLEPVRRNLDMTLHYVHANGEIVTDASRRQDQYQRATMEPYYYPYRYLALHDQNGRYAAMARLIEKSGTEKLADEWIFFQEEPALKADLPALEPLPENFLRLFSHSQLVRIRRGPVSATVLAQNPNFFSFHKGAAALEAVRLAAAFFGKGQFVGATLLQENGQIVLRQNLQGPYYQPLARDQLKPEGNWHDSNRSQRSQSEIQNLHGRVLITETKGAFELDFEIKGTDEVPVALELTFRQGGKLQGVHALPNAEECYLLEGEKASYRYDGQEILVTPGMAQHRWTQLRGALPRLNGHSVYMTGFTPFIFKLKIS